MSSIPVYISRYNTTFPEPYGSHVDWAIGQRCLIKKSDGTGYIGGTIMSETKTKSEAPVIDGARGRGRWVREIRTDDDGHLWCISEGQLYDEPETSSNYEQGIQHDYAISEPLVLALSL